MKSLTRFRRDSAAVDPNPLPSGPVCEAHSIVWHRQSDHATLSPAQRAHIARCVSEMCGYEASLDTLLDVDWDAELLLTDRGMLRVGYVDDALNKAIRSRIHRARLHVDTTDRDRLAPPSLTRDSMYVATVVTLRAYRGQGNASRMFRAVLARFGTRKLVLEVDGDNTAAIALYRKFGFTDERASDRGLMLMIRPADGKDGVARDHTPPMAYYYGATHHSLAANQLHAYTSPRHLDPLQEAFIETYTNRDVLGRWLTQQQANNTAYRQHTGTQLDRTADHRWIPPMPAELTLFELPDGRLTWHVDDALRACPSILVAITYFTVKTDKAAAAAGTDVYALVANLSHLISSDDVCEVEFARGSKWVAGKCLCEVTLRFGKGQRTRVCHSHAYNVEHDTSKLTVDEVKCPLCALYK